MKLQYLYDKIDLGHVQIQYPVLLNLNYVLLLLRKRFYHRINSYDWFTGVYYFRCFWMYSTVLMKNILYHIWRSIQPNFIFEYSKWSLYSWVLVPIIVKPFHWHLHVRFYQWRWLLKFLFEIILLAFNVMMILNYHIVCINAFLAIYKYSKY